MSCFAYSNVPYLKFATMAKRALSQAVSSINEHHHGSLLNFVLGMSFWNFSLDVEDGLVISKLVTSNGGLVDRWRTKGSQLSNLGPWKE